MPVKTKEFEEAEAKKKKETKQQDKVTLTALKDTQLADGTFVVKGEEVEVTAEYASRVKAEKNGDFRF